MYKCIILCNFNKFLLYCIYKINHTSDEYILPIKHVHFDNYAFMHSINDIRSAMFSLFVCVFQVYEVYFVDIPNVPILVGMTK